MTGFLRAVGGAGGPGVNGNGGAGGAGGGGGGGGGIIHLVSASTINAPGSQLLVSGGAAGTDASSSSTNQAGSGGGATAGNGGNGGFGNPVAGQAFVGSTAGGSGYAITTVVPAPENLFL